MPMFPTAEQSASFKQMLKKDPETDLLGRMAERHPLETDEAFAEVESGVDTVAPGSYVANRLEN